MADTDTDGDGLMNCLELCPNDPNKVVAGVCGCGVWDTDIDYDGTKDCVDGCPLDPNKTEPGACGCGVADVDADGDGVADCNAPIPTVSEWGIIVMVLLLASAGKVFFGRGRRDPSLT